MANEGDPRGQSLEQWMRSLDTVQVRGELERRGLSVAGIVLTLRARLLRDLEQYFGTPRASRSNPFEEPTGTNEIRETPVPKYPSGAAEDAALRRALSPVGDMMGTREASVYERREGDEPRELDFAG
ncbi:hypothetical protein KPH14_000813 [Odynerus spinipes]|uniref:Uncharacterized protein n=1 Tax=Odynerus spinipes TaxID=1348599 RepID=A0AAD9VLD0_9HYME|nr:hypothetical protein KPH14_000813 [Odynerus spinipes]